MFVYVLFGVILGKTASKLIGHDTTMELRVGESGWISYKWDPLNYNRVRYHVTCSDPCEVWYGLYECIDSGGFRLGVTECTTMLATGILEYGSPRPLHGSAERRSATGLGLGTEHKPVKHYYTTYRMYYMRCFGARALEGNVTSARIQVNYVQFDEYSLYVCLGVIGPFVIGGAAIAICCICICLCQPCCSPPENRRTARLDAVDSDDDFLHAQRVEIDTDVVPAESRGLTGPTALNARAIAARKRRARIMADVKASQMPDTIIGSSMW